MHLPCEVPSIVEGSLPVVSLFILSLSKCRTSRMDLPFVDFLFSSPLAIFFLSFVSRDSSLVTRFANDLQNTFHLCGNNL